MLDGSGEIQTHDAFSRTHTLQANSPGVEVRHRAGYHHGRGDDPPDSPPIMPTDAVVNWHHNWHHRKGLGDIPVPTSPPREEPRGTGYFSVGGQLAAGSNSADNKSVTTWGDTLAFSHRSLIGRRHPHTWPSPLVREQCGDGLIGVPGMQTSPFAPAQHQYGCNTAYCSMLYRTHSALVLPPVPRGSNRPSLPSQSLIAHYSTAIRGAFRGVMYRFQSSRSGGEYEID